MTDDPAARLAAVRAYHERPTHPSWRADTALGFLLDQVDQARARAAELEADRERLGADLDVYREEVRTLQEQMETIAYNRTWPHDRERPAEIRRELDRVNADARHRADHILLQYRAAQVRWQRQREQLTAEVEQLRAVVADLRALCRNHQAEASGGGMTDASAVWPSEILAILDGGQP